MPGYPGVARPVSASRDDKRRVHSALGGKSDAGLLTHFMEAFSVVEIKLGDAVVVSDK